MAAVLSSAAAAAAAATAAVPQPIRSSNLLLPQPTSLSHSSHFLAPSLTRNCPRRDQFSASLATERLARKRSERFAYVAAAVMSSFGMTSMVVIAFCYRFAWQMEGGQVPLFEMVGAFALSGGAAVGMEFLARWAHRALWHASLWHTHKVGMEFLARWAHRALWHTSLWHTHEGLGMAYVFVHRGFCMGFIAYVVKRIAAAHQLISVYLIRPAGHPFHAGREKGGRIPIFSEIEVGMFSLGRGFQLAHSAKRQMPIGEGKYQRVKSLVVLALLGLNVVASASSTLSFTNTCSIPIFPSLIPEDDSPKISNSTSLHAIGPNEELSVPLPDGWSGVAIFSTGCILNGLGARNCTTGNCKGRDCTAATALGISSDIYTLSTVMGYNVGLTVSPMCAGCDCPSASCKALLESCPHDLRVLNEGTVVACRPGSGLQFSENQCTVPGDYSTSDGSITCPLQNIVMKIEVSC